MLRYFANVVILSVLCCATTLQAGEKPIVAVFNIEDRGTGLEQNLLDQLSDFLATRLAEVGDYQIVTYGLKKSTMEANIRDLENLKAVRVTETSRSSEGEMDYQNFYAVTADGTKLVFAPRYNSEFCKLFDEGRWEELVKLHLVPIPPKTIGYYSKVPSVNFTYAVKQQ